MKLEFAEPTGEDAAVIIVIRHATGEPTVARFDIHEGNLLELRTDVDTRYLAGRISVAVREALAAREFAL